MDGLSFPQIVTRMSGSTQEDCAIPMLAVGRTIEGNRSKSEWWRG